MKNVTSTVEFGSAVADFIRKKHAASVLVATRNHAYFSSAFKVSETIRTFLIECVAKNRRLFMMRDGNFLIVTPVYRNEYEPTYGTVDLLGVRLEVVSSNIL